MPGQKAQHSARIDGHCVFNQNMRSRASQESIKSFLSAKKQERNPRVRSKAFQKHIMKISAVLDMLATLELSVLSRFQQHQE
jgi:hypothetical protein